MTTDSADASMPKAPTLLTHGPGWVFYAATAILLLIGLYGASLPGWDLGLVMASFLACCFVAVLWLVCFAVVAFRTSLQLTRRVWIRWLGIPVMGLLCAALIVIGLPMSTRFELSRGALDQAAQKAANGEQVGPGWIGLVPVGEVTVTQKTMTGSVVYFEVSGAGRPFGQCGLVRASGIVSSFGGTLRYELAPGWWIWCDTWSD